MRISNKQFFPHRGRFQETTQLASQPFLRLTHKTSHAAQGPKSPNSPRDCQKRWQKQKKNKKRKNTLSHSRVFCHKNPGEPSHFFRINVKSLQEAIQRMPGFGPGVGPAGDEGDGQPLTTKREPYAKRSREKFFGLISNKRFCKSAYLK